MTNDPQQVTIGESQTTQDIVSNLKNDGASALEAVLNVQLPWTKLPVVSVLVNMIVQKLVDIFIDEINKEAFALYVSIKTRKQVSDYLGAQQSGNQSAIDQAGDALIHLGGQ